MHFYSSQKSGNKSGFVRNQFCLDGSRLKGHKDSKIKYTRARARTHTEKTLLHTNTHATFLYTRMYTRMNKNTKRVR